MDLSRLNRANDFSIPMYSVSLCMITKEEHQKEKMRWQHKINELEEQLKRTEEINSQLIQNKAETNKKIKELEKTQKTLMKNNKKYQGKIKTVIAYETKHYEDKLKQSQDDLAAMKQCLEKISAECCRLKQRKLTADKEEELQRLRNLNVQYCKTIATYKQLVADKERKVEVLLRVINRTRKSHSFNWNELENHSTSDSVFSYSSQSFETLPHDQVSILKDQDLENSLRCRRLEYGNSLEKHYDDSYVIPFKICSLNESRNSVESGWEEERQKLWNLVKELRDRINILQPSKEKQQIQIDELIEANELLEFRLLEFENAPTISLCPKCCVEKVDNSTCAPDDNFPDDSVENVEKLNVEELKSRLEFIQHKQTLNDRDRTICQIIVNEMESFRQEKESYLKKMTEMERKLLETETQLECSEITIEEKCAECQALKETVDELNGQCKEMKGRLKVAEEREKATSAKLKTAMTNYESTMELMNTLQQRIALQEREENALMIRMKWIETAQKLLTRDSEANTKEESSESLRQKVLPFLQAVVVQNQQQRNQLDAINLYNRHLENQMEVQIETINRLKEKLQRRLNFNVKQQQTFEIESQNQIEQLLSTVDDENSTTTAKEADILDKVPLSEESCEQSAPMNENLL
ncbi:hypothetical protein T4B_6569 [Trichinella pseudospiralis]|uniref:Uncharacterized protein n=2 Tax=Trichinella pseudospiralis TaxID=6337 RepID=A0A0V1KGM5_TRIPS|nr:hypothetical protein T4E_6058 [Trichinella pseudospiralis]KRY78643.1 hypothetical protein T4A_2697 [Trichinella pseudospiralis]KRY92401.1 hypothetical protein T4D_11839 [Trichinella pseudospiralis]KRZ34719.1 hypothetical protein T4B_6569 [Trichinella pseudospiralis]KRZ46411.1 hypothetical protein T4C_11830 [Trichinella pseudospiralis]